MQNRVNPNLLFAPGFRLLKHDRWVLGMGGVATLAIFETSSLLSLGFFMATFHFFLFCNVFRIKRVPELIWSSVFLGSVYYYSRGYLELLMMFAICEGVAVVLIIASVLREDYHGIMWKTFNPQLEKWWIAKHSED